MICTDLHSTLAPILANYEPDQTVVIADEKVPLPPCVSEVIQPTHLLSVSCSESLKTIETVQTIWDFLLARQITRSGLVIAIGGGVLTDMAGFAAATYKRGIRYINVPTTLLAMVDASTGGKTGFNYGGLKNCIGAFYNAEETIIYPPFLSSLPSREVLSGFAEMLKTGLVDVRRTDVQCTQEWQLWESLLNYDLEAVDTASLTPLIADCVAVKERIVATDPRESGLRKALNLGHTFGHALEELSLTASMASGLSTLSVSGLLHGYAVLYGLIAELYLSVTLLDCPREPLRQLTQIMLHYYGKPQCKCSDTEQLVALMHRDKKNEHADEINCTLLRAIGDPVVNYTITDAEAREAWDYLFSL